MARTRSRILEAAQALVAEGGYAAAGMPAVAQRAEVSTGLLYRYFQSKTDLFDQVFRRASQHEIDICAEAAAVAGDARERVARVAETFSRRALKGWRLAYALLAEPVDRTIEFDRLHFREPYRAIFAGIIRDGIAAGEIAEQDAQLLATAIVGGIAETLVGPLSQRPAPEQETALVESVKRFCVQAVGPPPQET
ncbi:TetR/AcrR family transcriptional regulator [Alloalcanivorax xenomutans]|uniref:TetR/AcrR family transcriptional regulator n=1 Tax=Alloalcanivorax xenomutans TaxID=1094342 RepID=A0A9Q3W2M4_9GAMM|nr:TetR/AcrR family transcriptional regulator [Alloalcanivorax xenomutans]ERS09396.1 hypothetical protein Q668_04635 [Alcanivorax sp. PN-3]MCE7507475.1 TetR/AcrR family transcriptional regulator [Alloalcanivorax xenomutans]MCE7523683.1 TetR/AcrR family transcriptional regulator [Alloalcanivorax xenomutans]WOA31405.1 TetR/AcrR family transcriptional regulator [Alloalcanivorax xenomutans]WOD28393.1 TetR/AcrR family transcriptional regulator [Alloalcanivorax xenomutans]